MLVLKGDTIKLTAEFRTFGGALVDPTDITLKFMTPSGKQIGEIIQLDSNSKVAEGIYNYEYIVPSEYSEIIYEFKGLVDGKPIVGRNTLYTTLVKE